MVVQENTISSENLEMISDLSVKRNLLNLFLFLYFFILFALAFVFFCLRQEKGILVVSVLILFNLPLLVFIEAINSIFLFVSADICDSVNQSMYGKAFPAYGKGIGWFANCHSSEANTNLFMINNKLYELYQANKDDIDLATYLVKTKNTYLDPIITCDSLYTSLVNIEYDLCKDGPQRAHVVFSIYFWLFLSVMVVFWGINRLVPIASKRMVEYTEKIMSEEVTY